MDDRVHPIGEAYPAPPVLPASHERDTVVLLPAAVQNPSTGVVYKTPVGVPPIYPGNRPPRRRRSGCCCCLLWVFGILFAILVILGIAALVFYLVVQPRVPKFSIESASVREFNLTSPNSDSMDLTSDFVFNVRIRNPNKKIRIYYYDPKVTLTYNGVEIGTGSVASFIQGHKNTTYLDVEVKGENKALDTSSGSALKSATESHSSIRLNAETVGHIRIKIGSWKTSKVKVTVKCKVDMSVPSDSETANILSDHCKLKLG